MMSTSADCCRQVPTQPDALLRRRLMMTVADQRSLAKNVNTLNFTAQIDKSYFFVYIEHTFLEWYPSGKGLVCKTIIGRFDSYPLLIESSKITSHEVIFFLDFLIAKTLYQRDFLSLFFIPSQQSSGVFIYTPSGKFWFFRGFLFLIRGKCL